MAYRKQIAGPGARAWVWVEQMAERPKSTHHSALSVVHLRDHAGRPVILKLGKFFSEIDHLLHGSRLLGRLMNVADQPDSRLDDEGR